MRHFFDDVLAGLPPHSHALLEPAFEARIIADPRHPLRIRLRENAVDRSTLHAPVRVFHSDGDEEVAYEDALVSVDRLRDAGTHVSVEILAGFDHANSWIQAMPRAVLSFRSFE